MSLTDTIKRFLKKITSKSRSSSTRFDWSLLLKMASRGGSARRVPETEATITYVQCDGLVSFEPKRCFYVFISNTRK